MTQFNDKLLDYISSSPTPAHAVKNACEILDAEGFQRIDEGRSWALIAGNKYYVVRRDTSLIAFVVGRKLVRETGYRVLGAHTDSPCLKVKPNPDIRSQGFHQLGVDVYGGALLAPWFDRDLSLAGKISFQDGNGRLQHSLIDLKRPVAVIPSLAIHLDRTVNEGRAINPQEQMPPILWQQSGEKSFSNFRAWLQNYLEMQGLDVAEVLDFDLSFYDVQPGSVLGVNNEFLSCARLDNLLSCYVIINSLLACDGETTSIVVLNDHEEVGSRSTVGAAGNFLQFVLDRIEKDTDARYLAINKSMMMSVDNAHGIHPNFANKHDNNHAPNINAGPVLKFDTNQSYATQSAMSSLIRLMAKKVGVPLQTFNIRADMRCGSTIGPITATNTGIETLDIGVPTFAMHSIRELAGARDSEYLASLLVEFLNYSS